MSYKISAKNRRLKRTLIGMINFLKFEGLNIDTPRKIVFIGLLFGIGSLFLNWTDSFDQKHIGNAFKSILGITGYLLLILNIKMIFILFSNKLKELIKSFFNFNAKDGIIIIFLGAYGLFLTINSIFIIENFSYFTSGIITGKGVIFSIIGYTFCLLGGILMLNSKTKTSIYIEKNEQENSLNSSNNDDVEKSNMKLPF